MCRYSYRLVDEAEPALCEGLSTSLALQLSHLLEGLPQVETGVVPCDLEMPDAVTQCLETLEEVTNL